MSLDCCTEFILSSRGLCSEDSLFDFRPPYFGHFLISTLFNPPPNQDLGSGGGGGGGVKFFFSKDRYALTCLKF